MTSPSEHSESVDRTLGRIEQKVDDIGEHGQRRDVVMGSLSEAVKKNSEVVHTISTEVSEIKVKLEATDKRLNALERPLLTAMQIKSNRRALLMKIVAYAVAVSGAIWIVVVPSLEYIAKELVRRHLFPGADQ